MATEKKWLREFLETDKHYAPEMNVVPDQTKQKPGFFTRRASVDSVGYERRDSVNSDRRTSVSSVEEGVVGSPILGSVLQSQFQAGTPLAIQKNKKIFKEFDFK